MFYKVNPGGTDKNIEHELIKLITNRQLHGSENPAATQFLGLYVITKVQTIHGTNLSRARNSVLSINLPNNHYMLAIWRVLLQTLLRSN